MRHAILAVPVLLAIACTTRSAMNDDGGSGSTQEPKGCTQIGCEDGLLIRVTPTSGWPAGEYRFSIEVERSVTTCTGNLPLPACETRAITCDGSGVVITESGCALPEADHAFGDIRFDSAPTSVAITVQRDGAVVGSGSWTPEYQTVQPNGPGCGPTCTNATVDLALTF